MKTFILLAILAHVYSVEMDVPHTLQHVPAMVPQVTVPPPPPAKVIGQQMPVSMPGVQQQQLAGKPLSEDVNKLVNQHIDHIVTHIKVQRVPQLVLGAHLAGQKNKVGAPQVPGNVQQIVEHAHTHIPQVINQHETGNKVQRVSMAMPQVPGSVQQIVEHAHTHIPQMINEQITTTVVGKVPQSNEQLPSVVLPQIVAHKVEKLQSHVKQVMKQVEHHIPQVINHHITQQQKQAQQQVPIVNSMAGPVVVVEKEQQVPQVPSLVQSIVEHAHTHIPQVINEHVVSQQQPKTETM